MLRNSEADETQSHVAIDVWEDEGGALCRYPEVPGEKEPLHKPSSAGSTHLPEVRTWNAVVIFQKPFVLDRLGDIQPAGAYSIDTDEEHSNDLPADNEAWRRTDTKIRLMSQGMTGYISVDPYALLAALQRDNAQSDRLRFKSPAPARLLTLRNLNAFSLR